MFLVRLGEDVPSPLPIVFVRGLFSLAASVRPLTPRGPQGHQKYPKLMKFKEKRHKNAPHPVREKSRYKHPAEDIIQDGATKSCGKTSSLQLPLSAADWAYAHLD